MARVLYQFSVSHFCDKTRWNLDHKRLRYEVRNVVPLVHKLLALRAPGATSVPILADGDEWVHDSTAIAVYLDRVYPERPMLPEGKAARARALELEDWFDVHAGPAVRTWMYAHLLDEPDFLENFYRGYGTIGRALGRLTAPVLRRGIRAQYGVSPRGVERAHARVLEACDRIEAETGGDPARYLVGDALTIADLAAAALMSPLVAPVNSPYTGLREPPAVVAALRDAVRARPAGQWVMRRYADDRAPV